MIGVLTAISLISGGPKTTEAPAFFASSFSSKVLQKAASILSCLWSNIWGTGAVRVKVLMGFVFFTPYKNNSQINQFDTFLLCQFASVFVYVYYLQVEFNEQF